MGKNRYFVKILQFCSSNSFQVTGPKSQSGPSWKITLKDLTANYLIRSTKDRIACGLLQDLCPVISD